MTVILGLDLGESKGLACLKEPATTEARSTTSPTGLRAPPRVERPRLVVFEARTAACRVADTCDEPRLHSPVADSMHRESSRRQVERHTTEGGGCRAMALVGRVMPVDRRTGCKVGGGLRADGPRTRRA